MRKYIIIFICIVFILIVTLVTIYIVKDNKIDLYVNTNSFASKIERISTNDKEYDGLKISISGYIHYDDNQNCYIVRNYLKSDGSVKVGLLLKGDYSSFKKNEWVKVIGKIKYEFVDYVKGTKVPYIQIEDIHYVKEQEDDRTVIT